MTSEEAVEVVRKMAADNRETAAKCRANGDEYKKAAAAAEDHDLQLVQLENSSSYYALAARWDRYAEALEICLERIVP